MLLLSRFYVWYRALRPFSYSASIVPVLVGSAAAWYDGHMSLPLFLAAILGSVAIQAGTNLSNEYFDYVQGVDSSDSLGPAGVIIEGKLSARDVFRAAIAAFAIGVMVGIYIVISVGIVILIIGIASVLAAWFYTAKPLSLGYRGLGEPEVFIFMGPVAVMGAYYVQARMFDLSVLLLSLPIGFLVTSILHANNLRDVVEDSERGRLTWVVFACKRLGFEQGRKFSRRLYYGMLAAAYLILAWIVIANLTPPLTLLTAITIPQAYRVVKFVSRGVEGRALSFAVKGTAFLQMAFGITLTAGYLLSTAIR